MNVHETTGEIVNEVVWDKDGNKGCPMAIVQIAAASVALAAVLYFSFVFLAPALVNLWW